MELLAQYNGTHYVGSGEEFETIQEAVDSLVSQGVDGAVLIVVKAKTGHYNEQINITPIPGASAVNTITFQSETKTPDDVWIYYNATGSGNNYVIYFNECDYVTFEYFKIINSTTASSYSQVINFNGTAEYNKIRYNTLIGESGSPTGGNESVIGFYREIVNGTEILNNDIQGGSYAVRFDVYNFDTEISQYVKINNNTCNSYMGIYLEDQYYVEVIGNEINTNYGDGLYLQACKENIKIIGNKISAYSTSAHEGIYINDCDGSIAFQGQTSNNVIFVNDNGDNNDKNYGIHVNESNYQNFYHNTIYLKNTNSTGYGFYATNGTDIVVKNNLFVVENFGYAYGTNIGTNITTSDYNNYYTSGNYIANWNGNIDELSNLQAANSKDANSKVIYPSFIATSDITGLIPQTHWLDDTGDDLTGTVDYDIDSVARPASPDVGAYEFTATNTTTYSGNLTIQASGGTFTTFNEAVDSLEKLGISGPVTIDVETNTYSELIAIPEIPGTSSVNTVTFQSASGDSTDVILQHSSSSSSDNYVVFLNSTDYVTFKEMTLRNTGSSYARIFRLNGRARNVTITNNTLIGNGNAADTDTRAIISCTDDNLENITITNNVFTGGDRGIYLSGPDATDKTTGGLFSNNELSGYRTSILLDDYTDFEISNNYVESFTWAGICVNWCSSPYTVKNNEVYSDVTDYYGISLFESIGSGDGGLVFNNFVYVEGGNIAGIRIYDCGYQSIYNNSVNLVSTNGSAKALFYDYYNNAYTNNIFKNNNLYVDGPGYPMYVEAADIVVSESDYNNLYTSGTFVARWISADYSDISSLTATSSNDANSVSYNPGYAFTTDLHSNSYWLDGAGVQIPGGLVSEDIDGEARSNPPDIGADEYTSTLIPYDGEYTIGSSGRFASFSIAVDSLIERGILDTVIFKVQEGFYNEQFEISQIANASSDAVIIFESETGNASNTVLTFNPTSGNNYIVKLAGADYITFKNLGFQSGTDGYARIFTFEGKCESINFTGNILSGRSESSTSDADAIFYAKDNTPILNDILINDNTISNGSFGIYFENNSGTYGEGLEISGNNFNNYYQGAYTRYFVAPKIESNAFSFSRNDGIGINIQNCSSAATYGMVIRYNKIYADVYTNANGAIYLLNCDANSSFPGLIANNVIRVGINDTYRSIGLYVNDCDYLNFYHNTVNITSNNATDIAFHSYNSNYNNIVNNNFVIKGDVEDKTSCHGYAIHISNGTVGTCNYNNYYSAGKYLAYWVGTNYGTLADLKAATGKDANSINYFPGFRGTNNLTMRSSWLDDKGTPIASVTDDIDGTARDGSNPDIGAYEYESTLSPIAEGTYTVGSFGADYPDLDSLSHALMEQGIAGPVTIELLSGSYSNTHITIKDIPGTSATDTIVIQSQSGDPSNTVISYNQESGNNYILRLAGADYITIKDLTFNSGGTNYTRILMLEGNSQYINVIDNAFNGVSTTSDDYENKTILYVGNDQIIDNLLIKGNTFVDNSYGFYFGGNLTYNHNSIKVVDNQFDGQFRHVYIYRTKKPYIEGNVMNGGLEQAIYLYDCDDDLVVIGNKIFTTQYGYYGIYLYYCDGTSANRGLIANNFVGYNATNSNNAFCIKLDQCNYQYIYYNTTVMNGTGSGAAFDTWNGGNLQVANNIFVSLGSDTYTYKTQNTTTITASDYNNFYTTSSKNIYYNGVEYSTLADYNAVSLMDDNSIEVDPVFTSSTDFHVLADSVVGKAIPLTSVVSTDIDGETRDASTPDIGADEFSCAFYPSPTVEDVTACSNDSIPDLYAEGTNIKWYSDRELTNEVWSANEYDPGITAAGVYTFYVTQSALECTSVADSVVLTIHQAPELSADITQIDCQGTDYGAINLTVGGSTANPFIYEWSNEEIYEDIDNLNAGDYTVTVEDLNGCTEIDTFTVTEPAPIILDITTEDTECDTSYGSVTVVASGGESPYDYHWNTGDSTTVVENLYAGIYVVTVTDNRGCEEVGIATVSDIGAPTITLGSITDVTCYGGTNGAISLTVSGGATPYTFEWSNEATSEDISSLPAGPYELIVDDADGCQAIESFTVEEPEPIKIGLNITETSCGQSNGAAEANVTGGTSPYTYSWSTGSTDTEISGLNLGVYDIDITDDNGCTRTKYFSISEIGAPSIVIDSIFQGTCGNSDGAIYISAYGAYSSYTYNWSNSTTEQDLIGVNPGAYNVTVSDDGGCDAVEVATIEADKPEVNPICMVTVDSATNQNEIIWEKQYTTGVDYYKVYKETTQSGVYTEIGTVDVTAESIFVDQYSDVTQRSWRYKISVVDDCSVESDLSEHHKTMHLTINLGINNSINLIWNHYEGFDYETYYIHRRSNSGWELIDSVPSNLNSYTDADPIFDEDLYYMIEIKHPTGGCDPASKANRNTSRSNITNPVKARSDETPPSTPVGLATTEVTDTTISLIWNSSTDDSGVTGYEVYQDNVMLEEVTDTTFKATGLSPSTSYAFYIIANDGSGNSSSPSSTLNVTTTGSTGIADIESSIKSVNLYPNPNTGQFILNIETDKEIEIWYEIYSINGIMINNGYIGHIKGNVNKEINISEHGDGMYFMKIYNKESIQIKRILISK